MILSTRIVNWPIDAVCQLPTIGRRLPMKYALISFEEYGGIAPGSSTSMYPRKHDHDGANNTSCNGFDP